MIKAVMRQHLFRQLCTGWVFAGEISKFEVDKSEEENSEDGEDNEDGEEGIVGS
jgi:hypothetical protein